MAWLPGQTWVGSVVLVFAAQIAPSRFTTAPHIRWPLKSPPASPPAVIALCSRVLSCAAVGRPAQLDLLSSAKAGAAQPAIAISRDASRTVFNENLLGRRSGQRTTLSRGASAIQEGICPPVSHGTKAINLWRS